MKRENVILGAGMTGLSAGINLEMEVVECNSVPGGNCMSYYIGLDGKRTKRNDKAYRFEIGGGHWIFGADKEIFNFITALTLVKIYERKSAVYLPELDLFVPFPIQNHLFYLPKSIRETVLKEILKSENCPVTTLADWLEINFGKTLCELFFFPFHHLYTAGLYSQISPQDPFKSPVNKELIIKGAENKTPTVGYNATFIYPQYGLDSLVEKMVQKCHIYFNKNVIKFDVKKKEIIFTDRTSLAYETIISTLPLNKVLKMAGFEYGNLYPYTSILVINIGGKKGEKCPDDYWVYIPRSKAGFHRVGFYSNVDISFLPSTTRSDSSEVSIYVEKAFKMNAKPSLPEIEKICEEVIQELKSWGFITEAEVVSTAWVEIAYTWQWPKLNKRDKALCMLRKHGIYQTGRYGKWKFQGIAESIKDGLNIGKEINYYAKQQGFCNHNALFDGNRWS